MANNNAQALGFHSKIERNVTLLLVLSLLVVTIGGIVEIEEGMADYRGHLRSGRHHCVYSASSRALNQSPLARTQ